VRPLLALSDGGTRRVSGWPYLADGNQPLSSPALHLTAFNSISPFSLSEVADVIISTRNIKDQ
jgi:hypothetical protein